MAGVEGEAERAIVSLRGHRVMLDEALAQLYGVTVKVLNQSVKRNLERFPDDFMFQLTEAESKSLRSQIVTLDTGGRGEHRKYRPYAFTEQGVAMLSGVLRSPRAVQANIAIMRAFVRLRRTSPRGPGFRKIATLQRCATVWRMNDRRLSERRTHSIVAEPISRRRERRGEERRESPRREIALDVREPGKKSRSCVGDLSVSGASFITTTPPMSDSVEMMFTVPGYVGPIIASGVVVARRGAVKGTQVSVVFTDIDVEAELAIAQWVEPRPAHAAA